VTLFEFARMGWIFDVIPNSQAVRLAASKHRLERSLEITRARVGRVARVLGERLKYVPTDDLVGIAPRGVQTSVADIQDDKVGTEQRDGARHVLEGSLIVDDL